MLWLGYSLHYRAALCTIFVFDGFAREPRDLLALMTI